MSDLELASTSSPTRKQPTWLTLQQKKVVLELLEQGKFSRIEIARKYGVHPRTISSIQENRVKLLGQLAAGAAKTSRVLDYEEIDREVARQCRERRARGEVLFWSEVKSAARKYARVQGVRGFMASDGWVQKFLKRHKLKLGRGEVGAIETTEVEPETEVETKKVSAPVKSKPRKINGLAKGKAEAKEEEKTPAAAAADEEQPEFESPIWRKLEENRKRGEGGSGAAAAKPKKARRAGARR